MVGMNNNSNNGGDGKRGVGVVLVRYFYLDGVLKGYRRGGGYLGDFKEFEFLKWVGLNC